MNVLTATSTRLAELATWIAALPTPRGQHATLADAPNLADVTSRAKDALGLPACFALTAGASNRINEPADVMSSDDWMDVFGDGSENAARFALDIVLMDDPDAASRGGTLRETTSVADLVNQAKIVLGAPIY